MVKKLFDDLLELMIKPGQRRYSGPFGYADANNVTINEYINRELDKNQDAYRIAQDMIDGARDELEVVY